MKLIIRLFTHGIALAIGFALGVYFLPILTAPQSPDAAELQDKSEGAAYSATFTRDLKGSDFLHWGEGTINITDNQIVHMGKLAPGPDYKLYLTTDRAENEAEFNALKASSVQIGDVKSFGGFVLDLPENVDPSAYKSVVIWCEAFGEFITSAVYNQ